MADMVHAGFKVSMTDRHKFRVDELDREYDSWEKATEAIDRHLKESEKTKKVKLDVKVLSDQRDGTFGEHVLTGIHAGHKNMILKPATTRYSSSSCIYLDTPAVRAAFNALKAAEDRVNAIQKFLSKYKIETVGIYFNGYDAVMESLQQSIEKAQKCKAEFKE